MKYIKNISLSVLLIIPIISNGQELAQSFTTLQVLTNTLRPDVLANCVQPRLLAVCVFLNCNPVEGSCGIETSLAIRHWNADLLIESCEQPGECPWAEMRLLWGGVQRVVLKSIFSSFGLANGITPLGGRPITGPSRSKMGQYDMHFREVNAWGHPLSPGTLISTITAALPVGFACPSETRPFQPYYQSTLDPMGWRFSMPDRLDPRSWIPQYREIGGGILSGRWSWGAVWPRSGFILGYYAPKIGQALCHRVASLVTDQWRYPRVYHPTWMDRPDVDTMHMLSWPTEADERGASARYQMIHPEVDNRCTQIAYSNSMGWVLSHTDDDAPFDSKNTAWAVWRPYACCPNPNVAQFLFTIPIGAEIPLDGIEGLL